MNKLIESLKEQRQTAIDSAEELQRVADDASRSLDEGETTKFAEYMARAEELAEDIARRERLDAIKTVTAKTDRMVTPHIETATSDIQVIRNTNVANLRAFKGERAAENAYRAGRWVAGFLFDDPNSRDWCREHGVEQRVMTESVSTKGGATVPDEFENAVINLRDSYGLARQECNVVQMASDHMLIPRRTGGVTVYYVGEADALTASDMSWDNVALTAKKWAAMVYLSTDLSEDSVINMADWLASEIGLAFATKEDQCLIDGDGTSTYSGIVGFRPKMIDGDHDGSYFEATATADYLSELAIGDLTSTMTMLPAYAEQRGPKWYTSQYGWAGAFQRLAAANATFVEYINGAPSKQFMGYPVVTSAAMPTSASFDAAIGLVFGNMSQAATLGTRRGITVKVDGSLRLGYDQLAIQATERFDINVHDVGDASNAGPIVGVLGNSA